MSGDLSFKEIEEMNRELQQIPEDIDLSKVAKNTVGGRSADDEQSISKFLPSEEDEFKTAESLGAMFDTTRRAGAGGTKSGVVGLRPSGGKAAARFLEKFTGTGRMEKKQGAFEGSVEDKIKRQGGKLEGKQVPVTNNRVIIYEKCMDCMKPVSRDSCVPCALPIPPLEMLNPITAAKWEAVGLRPGDFLCYLFCVNCAQTAHNEAQKRNRSGLDLVIGGQVVKEGQRYLKERGQRIEDNVFNYIKRERHNPQTDIFYGECAERS